MVFMGLVLLVVDISPGVRKCSRSLLTLTFALLLPSFFVSSPYIAFRPLLVCHPIFTQLEGIYFLKIIYTSETAGGPGGRDRTLALKSRKTLENQLIYFCIYLLGLPKYWGKQIFTHGRSAMPVSAVGHLVLILALKLFRKP